MSSFFETVFVPFVSQIYKDTTMGPMMIHVRCHCIYTLVLIVFLTGLPAISIYIIAGMLATCSTNI